MREYYRLDTLLNAVSAMKHITAIYRQPVSRETVMELLILRVTIFQFAASQHCDLVGELEDRQRSLLSPLRLGSSAQR